MTRKPKNDDSPKPIVPDLDTKQVTQALINHLDAREYAAFTEVATVAGKKLEQSQRFMDVWGIRLWGMTETVAYEVKVSRSDFFSEAKKPLKKRDALRLSNCFAFCVPANMVSIEEVPETAGLLYVNADYSITTVIKPPFRDIPPLPRNFISIILRKLDKPRYYELMRSLGDDELNEAVGNVMLETLDKHSEKWSSVTVGDKTVPDKIALALKDLKHDILQELVIRKIYK